MRLNFEDGHIEAWDDKGKRILGVRSATVYLNERGLSEVGLFFDRVESVTVDGVKRGAEGVRDVVPEPEYQLPPCLICGLVVHGYEARFDKEGKKLVHDSCASAEENA